MREDTISINFKTFPIVSSETIPQMDPDIANINVIHADTMDVIQIPNRMGIASRDEYKLTWFLDSLMQLCILAQWLIILWFTQRIDVKSLAQSMRVQIDQVMS